MADIQEDQQKQKDQMSSSIGHEIFRAHALQHYIQKNEENILPRTISPFIFTCCWIALSLTILLGFLIWSVPVPNYLNTLGLPTFQGLPANTTQTPNIFVFFPPGAQAYIHAGQIVQVNDHNNDSTLAGRVVYVDTKHLNTTQLQKNYALRPEMVQFLPAPDVFVATIMLPQRIPLQNNTNDRLSVRYQQGTKQALSLLR